MWVPAIEGWKNECRFPGRGSGRAVSYTHLDVYKRQIENLVRTTANAAQSEFISACDLAYMQVSSGAFDYNTAIRHAVDSAAKGGLRVRYPTGWSDHLDVAVRRAVLTSVNQTRCV